MPDRPHRVERIGNLIDESLSRRLKEGMAGWQAVDRWSNVVGSEASRRCAAVAFRDGQLIVEVVSSVWMYQLTAQKRGLLERLNRELGAGVVRDVVFRVNPTLTRKASA
jgi:predicted nucleic acid-binding Zn ribbon protein